MTLEFNLEKVSDQPCTQRLESSSLSFAPVFVYLSGFEKVSSREILVMKYCRGRTVNYYLWRWRGVCEGGGVEDVMRQPEANQQGDDGTVKLPGRCAWSYHWRIREIAKFPC